MRRERRWVRADGKRPIMPDGRPASSTRACTWSSFSEVQAGAGDGYGVMLGGGLACWDLDDCFDGGVLAGRSEEHTSELQSRGQLVCRLLLEKKNRAKEREGGAA